MNYYLQLNFNNLKSGKIVLYPGSTYTATTGWAACETGEITTTSPNTYWRAFFSFNTANIPDNAQIDGVTFSVALSKSQPYGAPDQYFLRFSIGQFIGAALNGNAGEWNGGTLATSLSSKPTHGQQVGLGAIGRNAIDKTGDTDVKVWDQSYNTNGGDPAWGIDFNRKTGVGSKCLLVVAYSLPSADLHGYGYLESEGALTAAGSATITGQGTLEAAGVVTAAATATATGEGILEADGYLELPGSADLTGEGILEADGTRERLASGTATGEGILEADGILEAGGIADLTGEGILEADGYLELPGSADLTGEGILEAAGLREAVGSAALTGEGILELVAEAIYAGRATAIGEGILEAAAIVTSGATATLIGEGILEAAGVLYVPPWAQHYATRSVASQHTATLALSALESGTRSSAPVDSATRAVSAVDARSLDCTEQDERERNPRRLSS